MAKVDVWAEATDKVELGNSQHLQAVEPIPAQQGLIIDTLPATAPFDEILAAYKPHAAPTTEPAPSQAWNWRRFMPNREQAREKETLPIRETAVALGSLAVLGAAVVTTLAASSVTSWWKRDHWWSRKRRVDAYDNEYVDEPVRVVDEEGSAVYEPDINDPLPPSPPYSPYEPAVIVDEEPVVVEESPRRRRGGVAWIAVGALVTGIAVGMILDKGDGHDSGMDPWPFGSGDAGQCDGRGFDFNTGDGTFLNDDCVSTVQNDASPKPTPTPTHTSTPTPSPSGSPETEKPDTTPPVTTPPTPAPKPATQAKDTQITNGEGVEEVIYEDFGHAYNPAFTGGMAHRVYLDIESQLTANSFDSLESDAPGLYRMNNGDWGISRAGAYSIDPAIVDLINKEVHEEIAPAA